MPDLPSSSDQLCGAQLHQMYRLEVILLENEPDAAAELDEAEHLFVKTIKEVAREMLRETRCKRPPSAEELLQLPLRNTDVEQLQFRFGMMLQKARTIALRKRIIRQQARSVVEK